MYFRQSTTNASLVANTYFDKIQRISVSTTDKRIRVPMMLLITNVSYRKVMRHFFRQIKHLMDTNFFQLEDFISTVAFYFVFKTGMAESESEIVVLKIHSTFFDINNFTGVGFRDSGNKAFTVNSFNLLPSNLTIFLFVQFVLVPKLILAFQVDFVSLNFRYSYLKYVLRLLPSQLHPLKL